MPVLASRLDRRAEVYLANRAFLLDRLAELDEQLALARGGGGPRMVERHRARGKLLPRERIELLVDRDAHFLELSPLAAWGTEYPVGASVVTGVGVVSGVECVVAAHHPTVRGGGGERSGRRRGGGHGAARTTPRAVGCCSCRGAMSRAPRPAWGGRCWPASVGASSAPGRASRPTPPSTTPRTSSAWPRPTSA